MIGEKPKTYCDKENGCMFCDLLLCDQTTKKGRNEMFSVDMATHDNVKRAGGEWKVCDSERKKKESEQKATKPMKKD